ncbi:glycosyltransferase [Comamonas aquatica]|uniref:glycosyltransferase n=1 Tax=Comamonas aquatica TaxID=225991 RepID=UPI0034D511DC
MRKSVAVLLAAYNGEDWLEEQLASILEQVEVDLTVYISLDDSSDRSREIVKRISEEHKNVILMREGKFGSAGKNFYGILKDSNIPLGHDYYCLADQDDIWLKEKLCQAIALMDKTGSSGYSSNVTAFWASCQHRMIVKSQPQRKWDYFFEAAGPGCTYVLEAGLYKELADFLRASEIPVERFEAHDWLIYAFARSRRYPWTIDERSYMLYRQHASNQVGANKGMRAYLKRFRMVMSGNWFDRAETLIRILGLHEQRPAKLVLEKKPSSYLKMAFLVGELRRKRSEQIYLSLFLFLYSLNITFKRIFRI